MMGRGAKLLLPLAGLIGVGAIAGLGMMLASKTNEAKKLQSQLRLSQQQVTELEAQNAGLMQQLKNLQTERKTLDERIASLHGQLSSATTDLERSRASLKEFQDKYLQLSEQLDQERQQRKGEVSQLTSERDDALRHAQQLEDDREDLQRSVSRWRERLALLDRDYRKLAEKLSEVKDPVHPGVEMVTSVGPEPPATAPADGPPASSAIPGTVELPPIIVRKDQAGMTSMVRGRIIEVNDPHNFIVIDKGSTDGVRVGMSFDILRGSSAVGRVSVIRVRPSIAAGDIVRAKTPSPLQAGDLAVQSSP